MLYPVSFIVMSLSPLNCREDRSLGCRQRSWLLDLGDETEAGGSRLLCDVLWSLQYNDRHQGGKFLRRVSAVADTHPLCCEKCYPLAEV